MSDLEEIRRQKKNKFATVLTLVSGVGMLFIGLPAYFNYSEQGIMNVNGEEISADIYQDYRNRIQLQHRDWDEAQIRQAAIQLTIQRAAADQHAQASGFNLPDAELYALVKAQFGDQERYRQALQNMRVHAQSYEEALRREENFKQYYRILGSIPFYSEVAEDALIQALAQERFYRGTVLKPEDFDVPVPDDEAIEAFYERHRHMKYYRPAQAEIEYFHFNANDLPQVIVTSPDELTQTLTAKSGERAAHYVIFPEHQREIAESWQKALQNNERSWADLTQAIEHKELNAEVGQFKRQSFGQIGEASMDEALFSLRQVGELSDLIATEYGLMLLQATEVQLPDEAETERLLKEYAFISFSNPIFELAQNGEWDKLKEFQKAFPLKQALIHKGVSFENDLLNHKPLREALFAGSLSIGQMGEPLVLDDGSLLVYRLKNQKAEESIPLDEVREQVKQDAYRLEQKNALNDKVHAMRDDLAQGMSVDEVAQKYDLKLEDWGWRVAMSAPGMDIYPEYYALKELEALTSVLDKAGHTQLWFLTDVRMSDSYSKYVQMIKELMQDVITESANSVESVTRYLGQRAQVKLSARLNNEAP